MIVVIALIFTDFVILIILIILTTSETMVEHSKKYCARIMRLPGTMDKLFIQGSKGKDSPSKQKDIDLAKAEFMTFNGWQQSASGDCPVSYH